MSIAAREAPTAVPVEKPRHIDLTITGVGEIDPLLEAFGRPDGIDDIAGLRRWLGSRMRRPVWPVPEQVAAMGGTPEAATVIGQADDLLGDLDVTGAAYGRSQRYGFHYLRWLVPGVWAWLLTEDEAYLQGFERHLDRWYDARDSVVGDWPGLDVIWYSLGTWARCHLLLPVLEVVTDSPLGDRAWARLLGTLIGGARWAHAEHDEFRHGNWQLASATQLLHIGSVLPDLVDADAWARRGRERIAEHLLLDVYPDGGHYERSPGYHEMCLTAIQLAAAVDARYGEQTLQHHPRLTAMHHWLATLASDGGWVPHLQDSGIVQPARSLVVGAYVLDDPDLLAIARRWAGDAEIRRWAAALPAWPDADRDRRWRDEVTRATPAPVLATTTELPYSGYTVLRTSAGPGPRVVINSGPHIEHELESHSHHAVLDLVMDGWGEPLLWEAGGPPSYDDPDYLTWFQSGRGHNTLTADDRELALDRQVVLEPLIDTELLAVMDGRHHGLGLLHRRRTVLVRDEPVVAVTLDHLGEAGDDDEPDAGYQVHWHAPSVWRRDAGPGWLAQRPGGPGVQLIVPDADPQQAQPATGRSRTPTSSPDHTMVHRISTPYRRGGVTSVLIPRPPGTDAAEPARASTVGGRLSIEHGGPVHDEFGVGHWQRRDLDGTRWRCDWSSTEWQIDDDNGRIVVAVQTTAPVTALTRPRERRLTLVVPARCGVTVTGWSGLRLAGVRVPEQGRDDRAQPERSIVRVAIPYAGTWTISGDDDG